MPRASTRVAISLPADLYRAVERARRRTRQSRSAVVQDAIRHWLEQQEQTILIREYEAGHRRKPESRREVKAAEAAAVRLLSATEW
jgi:metal-responsive CopG/Arc/MetJ family transcriptional regulator